MYQLTNPAMHTLDGVVLPKGSDLVKTVTVDPFRAISDHFCITIDLFLNKTKNKPKSITCRKFKDINVSDFKSDIKTALSDQIDKTTASYLNSTLETVLDKHAPAKTKKVTDRPFSEWYNLEVKAAKTDRRRKERIWRKTGLTVHKQIFIAACRAVNNIIDKTKETFFKNKLETVKTCKELFSTVNFLFGKKSSPLPDASDFENANNFSEFFTDKINKIRACLDNVKPPAPDFCTFSGIPLSNFEPCNEDEIKKIIIDSSTKHCDLDPIPTALLKNSLPELLPYITFVINDSLLSGTVPCCYKNALVKPLIKKPGLDFNVLKNFRPVSNLPFLSKILEKVILKRLLLHLENNDLNEIFQSAYKKCHSTETALLKVYNDILCDLDKKHVTLQSLLDLSAAFDTLDHGILLKRLELSFGIKGSALAWFESYLVNRKQSVQINQSFSDSSLLIYGIPQGSVLGPILFSLYTTPLSNIFCKYNMKYHLYADDSQLYKNSLYSDLNSVIRQTELCIEDTKVWMDSNKLKLNDDKTELILFKNKF